MKKLIFVCVLGLMVAGQSLLADEAVDAMIAAADRFITSLDDDQKKETVFAWDDDKRTGWHYLPDKFIKPERRRFGLRLDKMQPQQRALAQALVSSALSSRGFAKQRHCSNCSSQCDTHWMVIFCRLC